MKLNPQKKTIFWFAVIVAAVGVASYVVHQFIWIPYMGAVGSFLVITAFVLLCLKPSKLNPPKKPLFLTSVFIAAVGLVVYAAHLFPQSLPSLDVMSFLFFVAAFILICLAWPPKRRYLSQLSQRLSPGGLNGCRKQKVRLSNRTLCCGVQGKSTAIQSLVSKVSKPIVNKLLHLGYI